MTSMLLIARYDDTGAGAACALIGCGEQGVRMDGRCAVGSGRPGAGRNRRQPCRQPATSFFSVAYLFDDSSTIARIFALSPTTQFGVIAFQTLPSHSCTLTAPDPSWSWHDVLTGGNMPKAPSAFCLASSTLRFSNPQRICAAVIPRM